MLVTGKAAAEFRYLQIETGKKIRVGGQQKFQCDEVNFASIYRH